MSARFGRNKKRKLRARIAELEKIAYGPYGVSDTRGLFDLNKMVWTRRRISITDGIYETCRVDMSLRIVVDTPARYDMLRRIALSGDPVSMDGRVFCVTSVDVEQPHNLNDIAILELSQIARR